MRLSLAVALALLLAGYACSDDDEGGPTRTPGDASIAGPRQQPAPAQPLAARPAEPTDGAFEISASGGKFVGNYLATPVGEAVIIRVTNDDTAKHNLRIAGLDGQFETEDDAIIEPPAIEPGGVGELTFAPPVGGSYTFRCDFHPKSMGGQIDVGEP